MYVRRCAAKFKCGAPVGRSIDTISGSGGPVSPQGLQGSTQYSILDCYTVQCRVVPVHSSRVLSVTLPRQGRGSLTTVRHVCTSEAYEQGRAKGMLLENRKFPAEMSGTRLGPQGRSIGAKRRHHNCRV